MREQAATNEAIPQARNRQTKPAVMLKRIGSTTFEVAVHFSSTSSETMNDKILRLIKNDANGEAAVK